DAGFSILKDSDCLSKKMLNKFSNMDKHKRHIEIGKMTIRHKEMNKIINKGLIKFRKSFMEENNIDDDSILSIKRDAIFVIGKIADKLRFSDNVEFVLKNKFTSYFRINKIEFYYN